MDPRNPGQEFAWEKTGQISEKASSCTTISPGDELHLTPVVLILCRQISVKNSAKEGWRL